MLGLSGGIDSALSCYLAASALGSENVLALRLPYETSSPESLAHAQLVIDATGVRSKTLPITEAVDAVARNFPGAGSLRRGNIMARVRMTHIYDQAAAFNGLVLGTGNKTEILLGYTTIHGDAACDLNPLGDLYKAQVIQLSEFMSIPEAIITKPPSADLWPGQTDEDELGFTYDDVDNLLYMLIEEGATTADCVKSGFKADFVNRVLARVKSYRYKSLTIPTASIGQESLSTLENLPAFI